MCIRFIKFLELINYDPTSNSHYSSYLNLYYRVLLINGFINLRGYQFWFSFGQSFKLFKYLPSFANIQNRRPFIFRTSHDFGQNLCRKIARRTNNVQEVVFVHSLCSYKSDNIFFSLLLLLLLRETLIFSARLTDRTKIEHFCTINYPLCPFFTFRNYLLSK